MTSTTRVDFTRTVPKCPLIMVKQGFHKAVANEVHAIADWLAEHGDESCDIVRLAMRLEWDLCLFCIKEPTKFNRWVINHYVWVELPLEANDLYQALFDRMT